MFKSILYMFFINDGIFIFTYRHVSVFVSFESSYIDYKEFVPAKSAFTLNKTLRGGCESG